jgi:diaminopimelate decarboxylase
MSVQGVPPSEHFVYKRGELYCDGVPLSKIAAEVDTPTYVYSKAGIQAAFHRVDDAMDFAPHLVAYAVKANGNLAVLRTLSSLGCGADIVSRGELERALLAGFSPDRIVFSGVGKRRDEIARSLEVGIRSIHVESAEELEAVESVAREVGRRAPVSLRVNPNVDPKTHPYIATGLTGSKFGIRIEEADALVPSILASEHLELEGVSCHIGSQLGSPSPLRDAIEILGRFAVRCVERGAKLRAIDVGGGWSLGYGHEETPYPPADAYGAAIRDGLEASGALALGLEVVTEPGRSIVGDAGVLLTRVLYRKSQGDKRFVIVDAAMTELIRPALYGAYHAIVPIHEQLEGLETVDIVGPVCESGDFLAKDRTLPVLAQDALIAIRGAGAYGREMSMTYNARPRAAEVMVDGSTFRVVRTRGDLASLWAGEST